VPAEIIMGETGMNVIRPGFVTVAVGLAIAGTSPCFAQFMGGGGANAGATGLGAASERNLRGAKQTTDSPTVAPPPVLPGTKSAPEAAAPTASAATMSPTDALFDAINRGDGAAARDAVNRGANIDGQNTLGLTPLELSVDLGRNDISFLLLSMRGEDASARRIARGETRGEPSRQASEKRTTEVTRTVRRAPVVTTASRSAEEPVVATPRLYSGNGGAPIPAAGFLGFDEGRSVR
jgi:hypothetical protein